MKDDRPKLSMYTVQSHELSTGHILYSNVTAVSVEDALRFERGYFGFPFFDVLNAWPVPENAGVRE